MSRCLLLTDGLANHGITDRDALASHASELRRRGVTTTTFGVGADFDERLLRDIAHEGGGNFYFIEGATQIPEMLTSELGEALEITLRDASLVVRPNGDERVESLNRYRVILTRSTPTGKDLLRVELGDLTSGQELDAVIRVEFPKGEIGNSASVTFELHSQGEIFAGDREVDRAVAAIYAARARAEANREGDYDRAERAIAGTVRRIREYAGSDRDLQRVVRALEDAMPTYTAAPMAAVALKQHMYLAETMSKGRDALGRARKGT